MTPKWKVNVWFNSLRHPEPVLVESQPFRFWILARLYAHSRDVWDNWRQTKSQIVRIKD